MIGDADLLLNYGDKLPTKNKNNWNSTTTHSEFIEINKNNPFFLDNNIKTLAGNYTVGVYGLTNTTYTLFFSSESKRIIQLDDSSPKKCKSPSHTVCNFKYTIDSNYYKTKDLNMIFYTEFLYGRGDIYIKLYDGDGNLSHNSLPNDNNYDYIAKDFSLNIMRKVHCKFIYNV